MKKFYSLLCIAAAGSLCGCVTNLGYQPKKPGDPRGRIVLLFGIPVYLSAIPPGPDFGPDHHGRHPHPPMDGPAREGGPPMRRPGPMGERGPEHAECREQIERLSHELRNMHEELEKRERAIHELQEQMEKQKKK
ncbi:hypothetical protein HY256_06235 [Candidatus Sumerlaeota bacterium]|nr:hypothetical protein [Candidatus Sumerlaeota bacterium]